MAAGRKERKGRGARSDYESEGGKGDGTVHLAEPMHSTPGTSQGIVPGTRLLEAPVTTHTLSCPLTALALLTMACAPAADTPDTTPSTPNEASARITTTAMAMPLEGVAIQLDVPAAVPGGPVLVRFRLAGYGIAPAGVAMAQTGHFHVLIDVEPPAVGVAVPADSQHVHLGGGQIEVALDLAPGTHVLRALLADAEHRVISEELVSTPVTVRVGRRE